MDVHGVQLTFLHESRRNLQCLWDFNSSDAHLVHVSAAGGFYRLLAENDLIYHNALA